MEIVFIKIADEKLIDQAAVILSNEFVHSWPTKEAAKNEMIECLGDDRFIRAALDEDENVLGFIGARSMYEGNVWELHPLVVRNDRRGSGIGSALVLDLERQVRIRGGITIWLGTDDESGRTSLFGKDLYPDVLDNLKKIENIGHHPYGFYQKLGYSITGVCPDANGYGKPDIYMSKRIK